MLVTTGYCGPEEISRGGGSGRCWVGLLSSRYARDRRKVVVSFAGESVYSRQEWSTNGAISAVLARDFGPGGVDPGERCFILTRTETGGQWRPSFGVKKEIPDPCEPHFR